MTRLRVIVSVPQFIEGSGHYVWLTECQQRGSVFD